MLLKSVEFNLTAAERAGKLSNKLPRFLLPAFLPTTKKPNRVHPLNHGLSQYFTELRLFLRSGGLLLFK